MRKILLIILFVVCNITIAQSNTQDSLNVTDAEGRKQGRWVILNKMRKPPLPGYNDEQKVEEGKYLDDKKTGKWIMYYPNGNMKSVITYESNRPNGYATIYHENGKILEQGYWKNQRWVGDYKSYHENGQVQHEFKFNEQGKTDGPQIYRNEKGIVIIQGEKRAGKEVGGWKYYDDDGNLMKEQSFNDGTVDPATVVVHKTDPVVTPKKIDVSDDAPKTAPQAKKEEEAPNPGEMKKGAPPFDGNGEAKLYNKNRQIAKDGLFKNFRLIKGKWYIYDDNGILQRIAVYEDGKYVGDAPLPVD